jgi:hypothetical protein
MSFGNSASKVYLTRAQTRAMSIEEPIGDPFGGPAFGEFNDPVSATAGAAAVGLGGAFMQANAAGRAADTQAAATNAATAEQRRQYDLARGDSRSFLQTGQAANIKLRELLGLGVPQAGAQASGQPLASSFNGSDPVGYITQLYRTYLGRDPEQAGLQEWLTHFRNGMAPEEIERNIAGSVEAGMRGPQAPQAAAPTEQPAPGAGSLLKTFTPGDLVNEPGYQFGLGEGNKAIENAARARGVYMSPSTVKELMRYGTDYAGTKYNDAFNRDLTNRTTTYNLLSGASGGGQVAANNLAGAGQASAQNIGNLVTSGANARGAAGIAAANAYGGAFNSIGNNAIQSSYLDRILRGGQNNYPAPFQWNTPAAARQIPATVG